MEPIRYKQETCNIPAVRVESIVFTYLNSLKIIKELVQNLNSSRGVFLAVTVNDELCKRGLTLLLFIIQT